jgi:sugar phosphate isomerase/epimerase
MNVKFGVQSYCFRNTKDNEEVAAQVKRIGLDSVEVCGVHVDFQDASTYADVVSAYKNAGVEIISTGVNTISASEADRGLFEFAKIA